MTEDIKSGLENAEKAKSLFTSETTVTWKAVKTMNREVNGKTTARSCFVTMAVLLLIGEAVLIAANGIAGYILMALAVLLPFLFWLGIRYSIRNTYEKSISKGQTQHFSFYADYFEAHSAKSDYRIRYDELNRVVESENTFYLFFSNTQAFIVNKDDTELSAFLQQYVTKQGSAASTGLFVLLMIATVLTTGFALIDHNKPDGSILWRGTFDDAYVVRAWVNGLYYITIILWLVILIYGGILRIYRNNKSSRKRAAKIILNIVTIIAALLLILVIGWMTFIYFFTVPDPVRNNNGTYTVSVTSGSGTENLLYEDSGPFYLHYLRPMTDTEDTDPNISEEEWKAAREEENRTLYDNSGAGAPMEDSSGISSDASGNSSSSDDSDDKASSNVDENDSSDNASNQEDPATQQIETGYRMIYNAYFAAQKDSFEKEYDAKANSYVVLHDDSSSIRYLMYDRDSKNGSCGLYVCYEAQKTSDGSWSPSEASILDMYAYEYTTGIVADSGKRTWADVGSEEFRKLTGE